MSELHEQIISAWQLLDGDQTEHLSTEMLMALTIDLMRDTHGIEVDCADIAEALSHIANHES